MRSGVESVYMGNGLSLCPDCKRTVSDKELGKGCPHCHFDSVLINNLLSELDMVDSGIKGIDLQFLHALLQLIAGRPEMNVQRETIIQVSTILNAIEGVKLMIDSVTTQIISRKQTLVH